ncbi:MAG: DNA-3-methyladenine glycosylase [Flavobacteriales bacterium]|nr:DNA-3-methyladenine glycosylase [Flavobacteriales bacterium]
MTTQGHRLGPEFYTRTDTLQVGRDLLGCTLHSCIDGEHCAGLITEVEAYLGVNDRASHAFGARRTARTEIMFGPGGRAYVYLCYGIHHLFNVVTHQEGTPHAILIRGIRPVLGQETMWMRRGTKGTCRTDGPGTAAQALGIKTVHTGMVLQGPELWITNDEVNIPASHLLAGPRIGVDYAGEDAALPYRFRISPELIRSWRA